MIDETKMCECECRNIENWKRNMMYKYENHRNRIFTEEGQIEFLRVRDRVNELLATCKYIDLDQAISGVGGSSWDNIAMVDRMVEIGELIEIKPETGNPRIFKKGK